MKETGTYILLEKMNRGYKRLVDQPWPVTEEIVNRFLQNGYEFQKFEASTKQAYFTKVD